MSRDFLLSVGYLFQTDDIFELHATFEYIGSTHASAFNVAPTEESN